MVDNENKGTEDHFKKKLIDMVNKDMIQPEQGKNIDKMIDSPDKENFEVAQELVKVKLEDKLTVGLNEDQTSAFADILEFLKDPQEDAFVLKGYAGTGKTFLVKRIIEYITSNYPKRKIAITAPTNKAVRVLQGDAEFTDDTLDISSRLTYSTIHKLLGLKEQITNLGEQLFKPDGREKSELSNYKYLIVDEVSMLDDVICKEILKQSKTIRIIFMGDPAQIPPVNRIDCIPFREQDDYKFQTVELTKIMRQTGEHPVVDASFLIRNNLNKRHPIPVLETKIVDKKGIVYIDSKTQRKSVRPLLKKMFNNQKFVDDADFAKVIAWRNDTVNYMNKLIRQILYGQEADAYVIGEKLIASSAIFKHTGNKSKWGVKWHVDINTSEELEVINISLDKKKFTEGANKMYMQVYNCEVKVYDAGEKMFVTKEITIVHENSVQEYKELIEKVKSIAMRAKDKSAWVTYFNIMKWTADVGYNYAITAHKAQGSTYTHVLLMEEDLELNSTTLERNRIKYTAYSRPTDKLFILRKNYGSN
jgi:DNA replication protein DnaC